MRARPGSARALAGFAVFGAFWGVWTASLPRLQAHALVNDAELGTALLWVGVGALVSIRWIGALTDRAERWVLPVSVAALGAAGVVPAFVQGVVVLSVALLGVGVCSGAVDAAINAAAVRAESGGRPVVSLAHGVFSLAVVVGSLAVAAAPGASGGRPLALIAIGVVLVGAAAGSTRLSLPTARAAVVAAGGPGRRSWPLVVIGALAALAYLVENAWQSWGSIHLRATVGASLSVAALAPATFALAAAAGRFGGHRLADRFSPALLFGAGAGFAAAGSALAALGHHAGPVLAGIAIAGAGTSVCAPTLIALAAHSAPGRPGAATGTVITVAYLGFVVGPAAVGLAAGATTLPTALVGVAAVAGALVIASPLLTRLTAP